MILLYLLALYLFLGICTVLWVCYLDHKNKKYPDTSDIPTILIAICIWPITIHIIKKILKEIEK